MCLNPIKFSEHYIIDYYNTSPRKQNVSVYLLKEISLGGGGGGGGGTLPLSDIPHVVTSKELYLQRLAPSQHTLFDDCTPVHIFSRLISPASM